MFAFLAAASGINAWRLKEGPRLFFWRWNVLDGKRAFFWSYAAVAALMVLSPGVILLVAKLLEDDPTPWGHAVLVLEICEIGLFTVYWSVQTKEHWYEEVIPAEIPRTSERN